MSTQDAKSKSFSPLAVSVAAMLGILGFLPAESTSACGVDRLFRTAVRAALGAPPSFLPDVLRALTNCAVPYHGLAEAVLCFAPSAEILVKALAAIN